MWITSGTQADWLCLLCRTSDEGGYRGMSQIVVPTDVAGFSVSRKLDKLGMRSSDTAELVFDDVRVPVGQHHRRGRPGLPAADGPVPERADDRGLPDGRRGGAGPGAHRSTYLKERQAFGAPLIANQSPPVRAGRHRGRARPDPPLQLGRGRRLRRTARTSPVMPPSPSSRRAGSPARMADVCLQFHGGMGYMEENWTARFFRDTRLLVDRRRRGRGHACARSPA